MTDTKTTRLNDRRRFLAGAGIAAGATALMTNGRAAADDPTTVEVALPLYEFSFGSLTQVGEDGVDGWVSRAILSRVGDMVAMNYRCQIGDNGLGHTYSFGTYPFSLWGLDLPEGFQPHIPPHDVDETGQAGWGGTGIVIDPAVPDPWYNPDQPSAYPIGCNWCYFGTLGGDFETNPVMLFGLSCEPWNGNIAQGLVHMNGTVPWGADPQPGSRIYGSCVFLAKDVDPTDLSPTTTTTTSP